MDEERTGRSTERAWKHRFAQTLSEFFFLSGVPKTTALDDAYAHADAQYLVRGMESPEDEARSALAWIKVGETRAPANISDGGAKLPNLHNGAHHADNAGVDLPE